MVEIWLIVELLENVSNSVNHVQIQALDASESRLHISRDCTYNLVTCVVYYVDIPFEWIQAYLKDNHGIKSKCKRNSGLSESRRTYYDVDRRSGMDVRLMDTLQKSSKMCQCKMALHVMNVNILRSIKE